MRPIEITLVGELPWIPRSANRSIFPNKSAKEAVRQAVSDTLARIATRDDLNTLLCNSLAPPADNVVRVSPPRWQRHPNSVRLTAREQKILERITAGDSNRKSPGRSTWSRTP